MIEPVESIADTGKDDTTIVAHAVTGITQDVQLDIEQLLELQSYLCLSQQLSRLREVDVADGLIVGDEVIVFDEIRSQCLREGSVDELEEAVGEFHHRTGIQTRPFHLLRCVVARHKAATPFTIEGLRRIDLLDLRMSNVQSATKHGRFAKHDIWDGEVVILERILDALEPHQFDDTCTIGESCHQATATTFANRIARQNLTHDLDIRH